MLSLGLIRTVLLLLYYEQRMTGRPFLYVLTKETVLFQANEGD